MEKIVVNLAISNSIVIYGSVHLSSRRGGDGVKGVEGGIII